VENLEPIQGKNPRPTPRRIFTQSTNGQKRLQGNTYCYKVPHVTSLLLDIVTHHVQRHLDKYTLPSQDKLHDTLSKVPLDLDTLNSLVTREMKREHLTKMILNTS